jgi:pimeloyl-ACP methyl ester carboxylesterase
LLNLEVHEAPSTSLFIHGAGGNHLLWRRTLQYLSGPRYARAIDLPGHPSGAILCRTVGEYAEAVHAFVSESGLGRQAVCGHSMGSAVALILALDHPADVSSLILIGAGAKLGVDHRIVEGLETDPMKTVEDLITPMSFESISLEQGREGRDALSISNLPVFLNDYLACNAFDVRLRLGEIRVPTLIICGEEDRMTPPKWSNYLNHSISESEVFFVRGAGHMVPLEKPEQTARLVQSFLSRFSL